MLRIEAHCGKIPIFVQKIKFSIIPFLAGRFKFQIIKINFEQKIEILHQCVKGDFFCIIKKFVWIFMSYFLFLFYITALKSE